MRLVRGMIGGDRVDRAISEAFAYRRGVLGGSQRGLDFVHGVVVGARGVGQREVMGGRFGGHTNALRFGLANNLHALGRRHMLEVDLGTSPSSECDVSSHHQCLGLGRLPSNAELGRPFAFVHVAARAERLGLTVLSQDNRNSASDGGEAGRVFHDAAHQGGILHAAPVVGEDPHAHRGEFAHGGEQRSGTIDRHGGRRNDFAGCTLCESEHVADNRWTVHRWAGVGHGDDRAVPTQSGTACARDDGLGFFSARLAQVRVEVDQPWHDIHARCIDHRRVNWRVDRVVDLDDQATIEPYIRSANAGLIDDLSTSNYEVFWLE